MRRISLSKRRPIWRVLLALLPVLATACAPVKTTRIVRPEEIRPALEATREALLAQYNQLARSVRSLNAKVEMSPVAGSSYTGVIEEYHDVSGFVLAQKPSSIRLIGQAPVVAKNIFDMVSDGETFRIYIPSKNKFMVGPAALERPAKKPIENLRPQHLLDALFWPEIDPRQQVLFEEFNADPNRYYILTLVRGISSLEVVRRIWFDRADLSLARVQLYGPAGRLLSEIRYADWQPAGNARFPRHLFLDRPHDDYRLDIHVIQVTLDEEIAAERFQLEPPPGAELVRLGEEAKDSPAAVKP